MTPITIHPDNRPRCTHWPPDGERCAATADGMLYDASGTPCPSCALCDAHAEAVIAEYEDKLREHWKLRRYHWPTEAEAGA